ncbi:hypothetical protein XENTR_v10020894 [Xenopus tropicalis]|nr:hypothetical protein XENTR_v10020894 [Xenopus tropicalis]
MGLGGANMAGQGEAVSQAPGYTTTDRGTGISSSQEAGCPPLPLLSPQGDRSSTVPGATGGNTGPDRQGAIQAVGQVSTAGPGSGSPGRTVPRISMATHITGMLDWVKRSVAQKTWARYSRVWEEWFQQEARAGEVVGDSAKLGLLLWLLSQEFEANVSVSSLDNKMAAWAFLFKLMGWRDFTKEFVIRQAVKGFKKGKGSSDSRRPITLSILEGLFNQLQDITHSPYEWVLFQLAFSWAFYGAFRISELVSENKHGNGGIQTEDVEESEEGITIIIRNSKTDREGKGLIVPLFGVEGCRTCPVKCNREYQRVRPKGQGTYLIHQNGTCLSRFQFIAVLKKALTGLGLTPTEYGSHSFRIGAATEAARWGLGTDLVKRIGRWESNRFRSYVRPARVECLEYK